MPRVEVKRHAASAIDSLVSSKFADVERMVSVPEEDHFQAGDLTADLMVPNTPRAWTTKKGIRVDGLMPIQSAALAAIRASKGAILPIAVGGGKALISLLAGTVLNAHAIVVAPARTLHQLRETHEEWMVHFRMPSVDIISYSKLSAQTDILKRLSATHERVAIVCDECHKLANFAAARTKRLMRFFEQDRPDAMFVGLSGTLATRSLKQIAHLVQLALGVNAPVPVIQGVVESMARCLDVKGRPSRADWEGVAALWRKYHCESMLFTPYDMRVALMREAFRAKFQATRGIVSSLDSSVGCSLLIDGFSMAVPKDVQSLIRSADLDGERPDGEILPDEASRWRVARNLSIGFYYVWRWPKGVVDREWMDARSGWRKHVRHELEHHHREGYDSPLLVWNATEARIRAQGRPETAMEVALLTWKHESRKRWRDDKGTLRPQPPVDPVWVSDFYIDWFAAFINKERKPWIIWYESRAARDRLSKLGIVVYGEGSRVDVRNVGTCAMSMRSQGTGLDLQQWSSNIFFEPPSSGTVAEQVLGRTHRYGQMADEVEALMPQHTESFRQSLRKAIEEAYYQRQTSGNMTKLTFADFTNKVDVG